MWTRDTKKTNGFAQSGLGAIAGNRYRLKNVAAKTRWGPRKISVLFIVNFPVFRFRIAAIPRIYRLSRVKHFHCGRRCFCTSKRRNTVVELILYITGRKEGRKRNGCRARAHLSEVNAHARTGHYFVLRARRPRPLRCEKKKKKEKYPTRFQIVSHVARAHTDGRPVRPERENGRVTAAARQFSQLSPYVSHEKILQRSNTAVLSRQFNICVISRSGKKQALSFDAYGACSRKISYFPCGVRVL